jgi:dipeptidyl aminopeptidase/acylaminoacyl peptidase
VLALILPALAIVALGLRLIGQERELAATRAADERRRIVADARQAFTWAFKAEDLPRLSRDGRFVALVDRSAGPADIHVLSADGRQAHRVTEHPAEDREPVWSPDGRHLAFISNRFGAEALWAVAMDGAHPRGEPFTSRTPCTASSCCPPGHPRSALVRQWDGTRILGGRESW